LVAADGLCIFQDEKTDFLKEFDILQQENSFKKRARQENTQERCPDKNNKIIKTQKR
jgi:hypothetical protein